MKRILTMILAMTLAMALLLCGCGGNDSDGNDSGATKTTANSSKTAGIKIGGATLYIGGRLTDEIKSALGEPVSTSEAPSCLYEGMDTIYEYEGYSLQTSQVGDSEVVVIITIETADHTTNKGVKVGDPLSVLEDEYSVPEEETKNYMVYRYDNNVTITYYLKDGKVSSIEYAQEID